MGISRIDFQWISHTRYVDIHIMKTQLVFVCLYYRIGAVGPDGLKSLSRSNPKPYECGCQIHEIHEIHGTLKCILSLLVVLIKKVNSFNKTWQRYHQICRIRISKFWVWHIKIYSFLYVWYSKQILIFQNDRRDMAYYIIRLDTTKYLDTVDVVYKNTG